MCGRRCLYLAMTREGGGEIHDPYWNPLSPGQRGRWAPIDGLAAMAEELILSLDPATGDDPADTVSPERPHYGLRG